MNLKDLEKQADEILEKAKNSGVEQNFIFTTTFERYRVLIRILNKLEKQIEQEELMVTKEYVKGRENIYVNPAITEYNKLAVSANGTAQTLIKIITTLNDNGLSGTSSEEKDPFK